MENDNIQEKPALQVKGSKFIAYAKPVETETEANKFIEKNRETPSSCKPHCFCLSVDQRRKTCPAFQ